MIQFFISAYNYFLSHKKLLTAWVVFVTAGLVVSLWQLEYKEDIAEFLPDNEANERINTVYQHIGNSNKLIINFSLQDSTRREPERIMEAIDRFTFRMEEQNRSHILPEMVSQIDENRFIEIMDFTLKNAPYFLTEADYIRMDTLLSEAFVAAQLQEDKHILTLLPGNLIKQNLVADPLHLFSLLLSKLQNFQTDNGLEINEGYLFSNNLRKGMVIVTSPYGTSETKENTSFIARIDQTMQQVMQEFPGMKVTCYGIPAVSVTNAAQIKKDGLLSISLSVLLIFFILIYFFRNSRNIGLIFLSVLFGWLFSLGVFALFKDGISVIALGISSIFIGIAINYPLHFIDHLRHQPNIKQVLKEITPPLLIGNITTVGAFLSLVFIQSSAMRDLGLCGSLILIGTILFVLLCLPHIVKSAVSGRDKEGIQESPALSGFRGAFGRFAAFSPENHRWILWPVLLLTCWFLYLSQFTAFELDMDKINYMTEQQKADMQEAQLLIENEDKDIVYFVSEGRQMDEALTVYERNIPLLDSLLQQGIIENIAGIGTFLASEKEQEKRIRRWNEFWAPRKDTLLKQIEHYGSREGFKPGSFEPFTQLLRTGFTPQPTGYFAPLASFLADRYLIDDENNSMVVNLLYCDKEKTAEVEELLKQASESTFFFDSHNILQRLVDSLSDDFNYVLYVCGFIVFIFLLLSFGRLELSLISFLPLAVSWIWILGIMQLCDMRFNIINIILATFIFGQGDDYTIFIIEGLMYEYTYRRKMLASYKNSILLSAIIMFIGIGMLIFAEHPAMRSLAEVTIIGMFSVVIMAYIIPPFLFRLLTQNKNGFRKIPLTIRSLLASVYSLVLFSFCCFLLTVTGFIYFGFGKETEKRKKRYHSLLRKAAHWAIRKIPYVKFKYENLSGETFEKPAIILSNHQSYLDLMCLMMLTPRLIVLTNDWAWHNSLFGRLIKYADFYPVSSGIDRSLEKLSGLVQKGYSIVVFPEGTRSNNCSIMRFHRGAFYLAEMLRLDMVPVLLHGAGHVLPKDDFMLRKGSITVQVHPRIAYGDTRYGTGYVAQSKQIRRYYQQIYAAIVQQNETAGYFKDFVLHNYLYKGVPVERSVRKTLKKTEAFSSWIDTGTHTGTVLVVNAGYGEFSFLYSLVHKQVQVISLEQDEDKARLAQSCAGIPGNLTVYQETDLPAGLSFDAVYLLHPDEAQKEKYSRYGTPILLP
ncbi:MAG: 1-acyl-sn-glycerol-3-phosphate acyltransferase [Dysgonamonadaceae bacterium]|jgi:1-acyl-sn-glycerol-3-phosphate acyltransferase|nr:1-acyl-sn-glycerol-3-phosphate acyltransferase [Dysgonamonadaceae bacterium]